MYAGNPIRVNFDSYVPFEPLTDDEWNRVSCLFQLDARGRFGRPRRDPRDLLDAILWVLTQDERWHRIPRGMPPAQTCYIKYLQWRRDGTLGKIAAGLESRFAECGRTTYKIDEK
jgi:transposase